MINTNKYVVIDNTSYRSTNGRTTPNPDSDRKVSAQTDFISVKLGKQYGIKEDTTRENTNREASYATGEFKTLIHDASVQ